MAAKNSMPERAIAQTENTDLEIQQENREKLRKKRIRALHDEPVHSAYLHERGEADSACVELYTRMERSYLPLSRNSREDPRDAGLYCDYAAKFP